MALLTKNIGWIALNGLGTLHPNLGIIKYIDEIQITILDMPAI